MDYDVFIGVDSSLTGCGVTTLVGRDPKPYHCGSLSLPSGVTGGARLYEICRYIRRAIPKEFSAAYAAMEGPSYASVHDSFKMGEAYGVTKFAVYDACRVEATVVAPTRLKLYATGDGSADKDDVIHAVKQHWLHDVHGDDNAADSFALAHLARALVIGPGRRRCEAQVVHDILHPDANKTVRVKHRRSKENI